jgi:hypothetical protein
MVRPEVRPGWLTSCIEPAGESPAGVSAGAPRSRVQRRGESRGAERTDKSLPREEAKDRAVTIRSEACSLVRLSAERRTGEPSGSCHREGHGQRGKTGGRVGAPRGMGHGTERRLDAEQERPSSAAQRQGEERPIRQSRNGHAAERESEGFVVPTKAEEQKPLEGRGPALVVYADGSKREGMTPGASNNPEGKAREPQRVLYVCAKRCKMRRSREQYQALRGDDLQAARQPNAYCHRACHIVKIIGKPCAGKPHARFDRGSCRPNFNRNKEDRTYQ